MKKTKLQTPFRQQAIEVQDGKPHPGRKKVAVQGTPREISPDQEGQKIQCTHSIRKTEKAFVTNV